MYAVIDCNNFFVSCERVFRPDLENKPVAVLSNNDGCIVSRSNEVKSLQVPMGAPAFKYEQTFKNNKVKLFSSNFALYADMSSRVMSMIAQRAPQLEVYSIDEAFVDYRDGYSLEKLEEEARYLRTLILKGIGIPVSIGIAPTKTLAKLANEVAKKEKRGVASLTPEHVATAAAEILVGDIWGIGRKLSEFLGTVGIVTVSQLVACDDEWIKKALTISGLKTVRELRGIPCISFEDVRKAKQSIISSKSFGRPVTEIEKMKEAVAAFTTRAAEKLREEHEVATHIGVWMTTNYHKKNERQYSGSKTVRLVQPTNYTPELIAEAVRIVDSIYKSGYRYKKALVSLVGLHDEGILQQSMFSNQLSLEPLVDPTKQKRLMRVLDEINHEMGSGTVKFLAEGVARSWRQRRQLVSPRYTTCWDELAVVKSS